MQTLGMLEAGHLTCGALPAQIRGLISPSSAHSLRTAAHLGRIATQNIDERCSGYPCHFQSAPQQQSLPEPSVRRHGLPNRQVCQAAAIAQDVSPVLSESLPSPTGTQQQVTVVMKFGGSSVATAERMREVLDIIRTFPEQHPCVVLSAMGKTTNLLLQSGQEAQGCSPRQVDQLEPLRLIREGHRCAALRLAVGDAATAAMEELLAELQQLLVGIAIMQEVTPRAQDSLVSFGERLSTRMFAAFLNAQGIPAQQYDAWDIGMVTSDDFTSAEVLYEDTLPAVRQSLQMPPEGPAHIPVVTGFLGRGAKTGAITTLGRGGSDLTATCIAAALGVEEAQVWKDVDGVLTSDPRIVQSARPVPLLTYEEATELAFFGATVLHPLAMQPAIQSNSLCVRVKNSFNRMAEGTLIARQREMAGAVMTSIVLKSGVTLMDIVSTRMLGQFGFLGKVFDIFRANEISVDVVATSEISISLTLDPRQLWSRGLVDSELDALVAAFEGIARASYQKNVSIISLICNVQRTSHILERVFKVLGREDINVKMMSQGASKTNISLIVDDTEGKQAVQCLHAEFFDDDTVSVTAQ